MTQKVGDVAYILRTKVADLPENEYVLVKIEAMSHERDMTKQYEALLFVIGLIPTVKVVSEQELDHKLQKLDLTYDNTVIIKGELSCTKYDISKIKLYLANLVIPNLDFTKKELKKNTQICSLNTLANTKSSSQTNELNYLNKRRSKKIK